jgi:TPR repeat protein
MRKLGLLVGGVLLAVFALAAVQGLIDSPVFEFAVSAETAVTKGKAAYAEKDYAAALRWYRLAAEKGDVQAQRLLGSLYADGKGVAPDEVQAVAWYSKAAGKGDALAQSKLGAMYATGGGGLAQNDQEAARLFKLSADQGDPLGQAWLAFFYENGRGGFPKSDQDAARFYKLAADGGNAFAQHELGEMYQDGSGGLTKDDGAAARFFKLSADQGDAIGQAWLAFFHQNGRGGLAKDDQEAARLYKLAADQGNAFSQNALGLMYENGQGVEKDYSKAVDWFTKADKAGFDGAKANLLRMRAYAPGTFDVLFTDVKAAKFENGHAGSCQFIATVYNNTKYHLKDATFKIGVLRFKVTELPANSSMTLMDGDELPYIDVSDGSADCADVIQYLFNNIEKTDIFDCAMTAVAEGDCQATFNAYTNINPDAVKRMHDYETAQTKVQLMPLKAALTNAGISGTKLNPGNQAKIAQLLNAVIELDSHSWGFNRYRDGSVFNASVLSQAQDGSSITFKGSFSYLNNGDPGWAKLTVFKERLPCIEFWDFAGTCRLVHLPPPPSN